MMLALLVLGCAAPSAPEVETQVLRGDALGTTWTVKWRGPAREVRAAVEGALAEVDARMSTWRDDSDLTRIRAGGPVQVSQETADVVEAALELAEATGGAFDPTVQPLVELWGFHGARRTTWPTDEEVAAARAQVGWERVRVHGATVDAGGTALDLSAIAKGHAVDRVSWVLSRHGLSDHLVEIGGEVRAHGPGPRGSGWRLGVDAPVADSVPGQRLEAVVDLANAAMATSGNYRNAYDIEGQLAVHTLDPRTGRPHASAVASATVVAPDCRTADGWATALMVLGEPGLALVEARPQLEALLLVADGEDFRRAASGGFGDLIERDAGP